MKRSNFSVKFWGARGTLVSPGPQFAFFGGNTMCVEVKCGDRSLIFDSGTGIRGLGRSLAERTDLRDLDVFFTHAHYDHVAGLPFFAPLFDARFKVRFWVGELDGSNSAAETIGGVMRKPYFPVGREVFKAEMSFRDVARSEEIDIGDGIRILTVPLNHPGGATGYRVDFDGRSFALVTDVEHTPGKLSRAIVSFVEGIELFAYDTSFTDEELPSFSGYGHSTWEEGVRLRRESGAAAMVGVHHMPYRDDRSLADIERQMRDRDDRCGMAREGAVFAI